MSTSAAAQGGPDIHGQQADRTKGCLKKGCLGSLGLFVALILFGALLNACLPDTATQPQAPTTATSTPQTPTQAPPSTPVATPSRTTATPAPSRTATSTPTKTATPTHATPTVADAKSVAAGVVGADRVELADGEGKNMLVRFKIADNLTSNMIRSGAQRDTVDLLKALHAAAPKQSITLAGTFPMKDQYGNTGDKQILLVNYSARTLDKINFDGIDHQFIWDAAEPSPQFIHPELAGE